jgi:hypothetical protein
MEFLAIQLENLAPVGQLGEPGEKRPTRVPAGPLLRSPPFSIAFYGDIMSVGKD